MATKLCSPILGGLVSNISTVVFVSNCVPGATIVVRSLTRPGDTLVKLQIAGSEGFLPLALGATLIAGDRLVAMQDDGAGSVSPETHPELAVEVGAAPTAVADIPPVDIAGRLWECGRYAYVGSAIPGATVEIIRNGTSIGNAVANGGVARIALTQAFSTSAPVEVRQRIGALAGPAMKREVEDLPGEPGDALPRPVILKPIRACNAAIRVEGVFEGADVTLTRKSGQIETAAFDLSGLWFTLAKPLDLDDGWVTAKQDIPVCRRQGIEDRADVEPAVKPDAPSVVSPLCAGSVSVAIENAEKGDQVRISVGPDVYVTTASGAGYNRFDIEPLPVGTISVQIVRCGIGSDPTSAAVEPQPERLDEPAVVRPLVKCQRSVTVERLKPGSPVQVQARGAGTGDRPISDMLIARAASMEIEVTTLVEDDLVRAVQWACAMVRRDSADEQVGPAPLIDDPVFTDVVTRIDKAVTVKGTVRDAEVEIRRRRPDETWELIGWTRAMGEVTTVPLTATLEVKQILQIRQRDCAVQTPGRRTTEVLKPKPLQPILESPAAGATIAIGSGVTLSWKDPATGQDADRKAESFEVSVTRNGVSVFTTTTTSPSASLTATAVSTFGSQFVWSVTPRNSTGTGPAGTSSFRTPAAPDPTIQAEQDGKKVKVTGKDFAKSREVLVEIAIEFTQPAGSPNSPVVVNDNRFGSTSTTSNASGVIDFSFTAKDVLEAKVELTGTGSGSQQVKADPPAGAIVRIKTRNKPPIAPSDGSPNSSNTVTFTWQG